MDELRHTEQAKKDLALWYQPTTEPTARKQALESLALIYSILDRHSPKPEALTEWISVEDRLPAEKQEVKTRYSDGSQRTSHMYINAIGYKTWAEQYARLYADSKLNPTHWMPLPAKPETEGD